MEKENSWKIRQRWKCLPDMVCVRMLEAWRVGKWEGKWSICGEDKAKNLAWGKIHPGFRLVCHLGVSEVHASHCQIKKTCFNFLMWKSKGQWLSLSLVFFSGTSGISVVYLIISTVPIDSYLQIWPESVNLCRSPVGFDCWIWRMALCSLSEQPASKQVICMVIQKEIIYWHTLGFWHTKVGKCSASKLREQQSYSCLQDILHINIHFPSNSVILLVQWAQHSHQSPHLWNMHLFLSSCIL